ncbi:hypothetical protein PIB30_046438, partial [Stylosanthes scabra]|nr:hypothetical protein [Stylosanthes scabra]
MDSPTMTSEVVSVSTSSTMVIDPYLLTTADQPRLVLVTQSLVEDNYHSWSRTIRKAMNSKRKLDFITCSVVRPDPSTKLEKFEN